MDRQTPEWAVRLYGDLLDRTNLYGKWLDRGYQLVHIATKYGIGSEQWSWTFGKFSSDSVILDVLYDAWDAIAQESAGQ